jgi:RHH-type proline utilization regulon transcriptional repressor/proline dehydrogenase/delta 1-pyrroline-5-carboxylate dehydrogenase
MPAADEPVYSPNNPDDMVGRVALASEADVVQAIDAAEQFKRSWQLTPVTQRANALRQAADAYETHIAEFCALLCREAGKTLNDAISEVREAVDFLRYYAAMAEELDRVPGPGASANASADANANASAGSAAHGIVACISPWNFPLAIFTGQIAGALVAGNVVLAKPAEQTPLIAARAVGLLHASGIPAGALQLLLGIGPTVGRQLTSDPRIDGVCFTGSTDTSRLIERALAARTIEHVAQGADPNPLLMAETGGLNAMIVDSSALTEQVVRDTVMSAFQSAGQRCSALRILYVQQEAYERVLIMLKGAMDTLIIGDPWQLSTDVGPVIDGEAHASINDYIESHRRAGSLLHQVALPESGVDKPVHSHLNIAPALIKVTGIADMECEIFGPVLHLASFAARDLSRVVEAINARGFGLTFGLHTRIDDRVQQVVDTIKAGNVYVNRNQIGAVVGSQPFGGEGLSGTGPKAGGPWYVPRLMKRAASNPVNSLVMPGPTGESNHWRTVPRSTVLVLSDDSAACSRSVDSIRQYQGEVVSSSLQQVLGDTGDTLSRLIDEHAVAVVVTTSEEPEVLLKLRQQLAAIDGPLLPLVNRLDDPSRFLLERHICIDTTAAGGNASLLGATE